MLVSDVGLEELLHFRLREDFGHEAGASVQDAPHWPARHEAEQMNAFDIGEAGTSESLSPSRSYHG
jgi:hypothetical protein